MRRNDPFAQRVLDCTNGWLDPREAQLCLQCEAIFRTAELRCPACGSEMSTPLLAFLAP